MTAISEHAYARGTAGLRWSGLGLVAASWLSAAIFGAYILAFYVGALPADRLEQWNGNLPGLYEPGNRLSMLAIGAHFLTGGILLVLGPIQLIAPLRQRWPALHRWLGRLYATAAGTAGLGGLAFILSTRTIGGPPMDVGFGLYGGLMLVAAFQTYRHARARRLERHRAWAIRLFALAIGSWLYRMDYGFWLVITGGVGHTQQFRGPFDVVMAFFFYLPNLAIAELFIRAQQTLPRSTLQRTATIGLGVATAFVVLGTYYFTTYYWGPSIIGTATGR